ncbi:MAG: hypothetical protein RR403_04105, partial [Pseudoflavonifractor sp.]
MMIRIQNIPLAIGGGEAELKQRAAQILGIARDQITAFSVARQSIDARKKSDVHYVCAVNLTAPDEAALVAKAQSGNVALFAPEPYAFPPVTRKSALPPVVVGMGPAGLFAALNLARSGIACILLEQGRPVEERVASVERFWTDGTLDPGSNVQFGEGGAGTFSDGKLTTGIHDPRITAVLTSFVQAGAPADIAYQQKPHIGTDVLRDIVKNIRMELLGLGCEIRFGHKLTGITAKNGVLTALNIMGPQGNYDLPCDALVLAPGHSARDTFSMLSAAHVPLAAKPFAIGVRIEHHQDAVSQTQYGPAYEKLPPADYKLACHLPNGRSAFSFCVCPGGQVVAAASEPGQLVTNGMSTRARDGKNINGGFLVGVAPDDFGNAGPLAGLRFQEQWERAAFTLGGGDFRAPAQMVLDFRAGRPSKTLGSVVPTYRPGVVPADLARCLPGFVTDTLRAALPLFDQKLRGFAV